MYFVLTIIISIIATIIIIGFLGSFFANKRFNKKVSREIKDLFRNNKKSDKSKIQRSDIKDLPDNVQNWLKSSKVIGRGKINSARLKQKAVMRLDRNKSWMLADAEQYFTVGKPGFIWKARIKAAPFMYIVGRDMYFEGKGNMLIKFMSMIPIANSSGPKIDQGTLLRFLAETVWFPTAALEDYIKWEKVNDKKAEATMSYDETSESGIFTFNENGDVIKFEADRYREMGGNYSKERWVIDITEHKILNGIKIPTKGKITWELDSGDFTWFKFEIKEIEYNIESLYE